MFRHEAWFVLAIAVVSSMSPGRANSGLINVDEYRALTSDRRAFRAGDPLIVLVSESTTAESSAGTDSKNDLSFRAQMFDTISTHQAGLGVGGGDRGMGQTARKGLAFTQVSVRVVEVLPRGLLRIAGEHDLIVNGEHQRVSVSGVVRGEDIGRDNAVQSNRIADAKIQIVGRGDVDWARRPRLLTRIRHWLGF